MALPATTKRARGVEVPTLGLGTWQVTGRACYEAVRHALELGYRHVDTAATYGNELEVGRALTDSGVGRERVWLTTKVWPSELEPGRLRASVEGSLVRLGVDRVDLLLIHWPGADATLEPALEEMTRLRDRDVTREIGVSNFPPSLFDRALDIAPVLVNQVEYHAHLSQEVLRAIAEREDALIEAYAPLGSGGSLLGDPVLEDIAAAHGRTPAQVALNWLAGQDRVVALPRSTDAGRRAENLEALSFELAPEERFRIDALASERRRSFDPPWAPEWED
jgi:diketogulonate reductase-like aldo/keto reductase